MIYFSEFSSFAFVFCRNCGSILWWYLGDGGGVLDLMEVKYPTTVFSIDEKKPLCLRTTKTNDWNKYQKQRKFVVDLLGVSETLKKWWWWFSAYLAVVLRWSELWPPRVGSGPRTARRDWAEGIYVKMGLCRGSDVVVVGV